MKLVSKLKKKIETKNLVVHILIEIAVNIEKLYKKSFFLSYFRPDNPSCTGYSVIKTQFVNRPGVAGAVLQSPPSFID